MNTLLGAHLSIAGGHKNALLKIKEIGGNCLQIFSSSPRQWIDPTISEDQIKEFVKQKHELKIDPIYFHASYLVNLADNGRIGEASVKSIITDMQLAKKLEIKGVVIHLGSFKESLPQSHSGKQPVRSGRLLQNPIIEKRSWTSQDDKFKTLITNCKTILEKTPKDIFFIIENAGSRKIGTDLEEIAHIIQELHDDRVRVCVDTCHTFVAGYDFTTPEKLDTFLHYFDETVGITNLELFHANDSKDAFHSFRDRHENIGKGTLGREPFKLLLNHPVTKHYPFILEVPGENKKGPNAENIAILKSLIS